MLILHRLLFDCCLTTGGFPRLTTAAATGLGPADTYNAAVKLLHCWIRLFPACEAYHSLTIDLGAAEMLDESVTDLQRGFPNIF